LILTVSLRRTSLIVQRKIGFTALAVLRTVYSLYGLLIGGMSSVFMAQGIGEKEGDSMKTKTKYTNEPMGELRVVKDFLPPPEKLVPKEDNVKVTISLKKSSITFFKEQAKKHKTSYQKMIREVVDWYASHYEKSA
jgi:hypothetical protein